MARFDPGGTLERVRAALRSRGVIVGAWVGLALGLWIVLPEFHVLRAHPGLTILGAALVGATAGLALSTREERAKPGVGHRSSLPGRGVLTFVVDEGGRARAWALWQALTPRIEAEGPEALESTAAWLTQLRAELADRPPGDSEPGRGTVDDVALVIAEQHLAPFVERWVPRRAHWCGAEHEARTWPLAAAVAFEYSTIVRPALVDRAWQLGAFAGLDAGRLRHLLPPAPSLRDGELELPDPGAPHPALAGESLADADARLARLPDAATRARLWALVVAGRATLGRLRKPKDDARARDAIQQAARLADTFTEILAAAPPEGSETNRALALLEGPLGRFLGRWAGWLEERDGVELELEDGVRRRLRDDVEVLARELENALRKIGAPFASPA